MGLVATLAHLSSTHHLLPDAHIIKSSTRFSDAFDAFDGFDEFGDASVNAFDEFEALDDAQGLMMHTHIIDPSSIT